MARNKQQYTCQDCGAVTGKWSGRCESCGAWNTILDEPSAGATIAPAGALPMGRAIAFTGLAGDDAERPRLTTGNDEFDRVTGGGLVPGSVILVGGDPGIGKSTLLLQIMATLGTQGRSAVYISGEESIAQVRLRARRLGLTEAPLLIAAETNLSDILTSLDGDQAPDVLVVDSIQTVWTPLIEAAPGTVSQLRASVQALVRYAKSKGVCVFLIGHVTKDGQIAGPRVVEHMVDTVLYFEGESGLQFRILRAVKNRFGPTDEIGVFEMSDKGLAQVANPSGLFLSDHGATSPGAAVFAGIEGTRPLLVEIQALVAPSSLGTPRRAVIGWDTNRLAMVIAVLQAHCGIGLGGHDVYLNVAGGLRIKEPAADLAVAAALISSLSGAVLPERTVYFGEISLSGAIRSVSQANLRIKEARKLGFERAVAPVEANQPKRTQKDGFVIDPVDTVIDLAANSAGSGVLGADARRA